MVSGALFTSLENQLCGNENFLHRLHSRAGPTMHRISGLSILQCKSLQSTNAGRSCIKRGRFDSLKRREYNF